LMDCLGDKTVGDLMYNNYRECNAAFGSYQESFQ
jgi:hypothetical protein